MRHIPPPQWCGTYAAGHDTHWMQAIRSGEDRRHPRVPGHLLEVGRDGVAKIESDGQTLLVWHHNPARLAAVAAQNGNQVLVQPHWALVLIPNRDGHLTCFSILPGGEVGRPCAVSDPQAVLGRSTRRPDG